MSHRSNYSTLMFRGFVVTAACVAVLLTSAVVFAATKAEKAKTAENLVKEALHREVFGMAAEREQLLKQATDTVPEFAPAMWHLGYVKHKNEWIKAADLPQIYNDDPRIATYHRIREGYGDTIVEQVELANWCAKRGLADQERAHLMKVLAINPEHAEARERLGFRRIDGAWMHADEIGGAVAELRNERESLAKWQEEMESILKGLHHTNKLKRDTARDKLMAITDVTAIPAMEMILSSDSEEVSLLVMEALDRMPQHEAAMSLARHAVYSPSVKVREVAAVKLQSRAEETYVPAMLSSMATQVESRMEVRTGRGGRLMYRHSFFREGQGENQLLVLDTEYRRVEREGGSRADSIARALDHLRRNVIAREMNAAQQNARTAELNSRIMNALSTATGVALPASPEAWWDWWNEHNEVFVAGSKQTRAFQATEQVSVVDRSLTGNGSGQQATAGGQQAYDCLAPGTLIWTAGGPIAIEQIQVGDLVLSQNTQTGELAYKPVLGLTVRPKANLVAIQAGDDRIETSGGHPFWVAGEGWIKARDLKSGTELHSVTSTVQVSSVERIDREVQTYNLIIADFNTYFVGRAKVLSHDNTVREATNAIVPGLLEE